MRFGWEAEVSKPLHEVLALLQDPQHPLAWQPGLVRIEQRSGELGTEGSVARYVFDLQRTHYILEETVVTDRLPDERVIRYRGRGMRNEMALSLAPADEDATTIRVVHDGHLTGFQRVLALPLRKAFRQRWRVEFLQLCDYLERS